MGSLGTSVLNSASCWPCHAFGTCGRPVWAVRPLAAGAPPACPEAWEGRAGSSVSSAFTSFRSVAAFVCSPSKASQGRGSLPLERNQLLTCPARARSHAVVTASASRYRARQSKAGRASTSCFAARAGEVRLLASGATQRKMQFRAVPCAPPNPSIERTRPGKPGRASHVKR
jgi:hypothetical protein